MGRVEYLAGYEGNAFSTTGDGVEDLLSKTGNDWKLVEALIKEGKLRECEYEGWKFFARRFQRG